MHSQELKINHRRVYRLYREGRLSMLVGRLRQHLSSCARFLHGLRVASTSRRPALMQLALITAGLALTTWGCGFLSLVFKGEDQQTLREVEVCDDLGSEVSSQVPSLVELRTDKSGTSRYRSLRLGGTEVDPQWVPMPNQHADATVWLQAGNFTKMDFQPPLQRALTPDSVTYVAYAPTDALDATERVNLTRSIWTLDRSLGASAGTAACIVTPQCTSCRAFRLRSSEPLTGRLRAAPERKRATLTGSYARDGTLGVVCSTFPACFGTAGRNAQTPTRRPAAK
jgi:hypothetical protein